MEVVWTAASRTRITAGVTRATSEPMTASETHAMKTGRLMLDCVAPPAVLGPDSRSDMICPPREVLY
jgi:hypothetical protein